MHLKPFNSSSKKGSLITGDIKRVAANELYLKYELVSSEPLKDINPGGPVRQTGLWEHLCFELFLGKDSSDYLEFNFSPYGNWQCLGFSDYRQGGQEFPLVSHCQIRGRRLPHRIQLCINVYFYISFNVFDYTHAGLSAVALEEFWSVTHSEKQPDFHSKKARSLKLAHQQSM